MQMRLMGVVVSSETFLASHSMIQLFVYLKKQISDTLRQERKGKKTTETTGNQQSAVLTVDVNLK